MIELIKGDCLKSMQLIEDKSIDAIITDPPYGTTACKWDSVIPFEPMWEQLNRIIKPNGAIVLFGSEPFSSALRMSNIKNYKYDWIWEKEQGTNFQHAKRMPLKKHEIISVFYKKPNKYYPQGLKLVNKEKKGKTNNFGKSSKYLNKKHIQKYSNYPKSVIFYRKDSNRVHPTQKPVALLEYLIKTYTNEKETVLDFTMGSGTTMVACQNTNRNGIGIEKDDRYFKIAQERVKQNEYKLF